MPTYNIRARVRVVAEIEVPEDGRFVKHGFDNWEVGTITRENTDPYLYFGAPVTFTVEAESEEEARAKAEVGLLGAEFDGAEVSWGMGDYAIEVAS